MNSLKIGLAVILIALTSTTLANKFKTEHWITPNGAKVVFYQAMEIPMLDISLAFAAGSAYDNNQFGLSALTAQMLNEGSIGIGASTLAETLANTGAQFDISAGRDMVTFNLRTLSQKKIMRQATAIFSKIINHPDFPSDALKREKQQFLLAIEHSNEVPDDLGTQLFFQKLYQEHPYAQAVNGTLATVKALTRPQVEQFYKHYYTAHNAVLVLVGAIDSQTAHQLAEQITQELPTGLAAKKIINASPLKKAQQVTMPLPSSQTVIRLGQLGIDHHNPSYFPLLVGNYILGGGNLVSRLAVEAREKRGLTYSIDSSFIPMLGGGPFIISLSTKNEQATEAVNVTLEVLKHFLIEGPTEQELKAAQSYLTGAFPMSLSSNRSIATLLLRMTFYNLPADYLDTYVERINQVTVNEIKHAFEEEVHPNKLLLVMVGQP